MKPYPYSSRLLALTLPFVLLIGCSEKPKVAETPPAAAPQLAAPVIAEAPEPDAADPILLADTDAPHTSVEESFISVSTPENVLDSPALWQAPDGSTWLYASAKETDHLLIYDGDTGMLKGYAGATGDGLNQFKRPNGIYVINDLLLVVERDNHRVQVLRLPAMQSLGFFGADSLKQPYGLWARSHENGVEAIISDSFMSADNEKMAPPLNELSRRFHRFKLTVVDGELEVETRGTFGATDDAGAIRMAESIGGDVVQNRLLLAEEDTTEVTRLKVYDMDGQYTGQDVGRDLFKAQAEGIALFDCADGSGYWIATDQFQDRSLFHVFDRQTLEHKGSFAGKTTANTDGVWMHQAPTKAFPDGVFYAVHNDQAIAAFDWRAIAKSVGLRASCIE